MINVILPNLTALFLVYFTMYQLVKSIKRKDGYAPLHLLFLILVMIPSLVGIYYGWKINLATGMSLSILMLDSVFIFGFKIAQLTAEFLK